MSFARGLIPVVGPPLEAYDTITMYNEGEIGFAEASARMAAVGGTFTLHQIVAFKHVPQYGGSAFHAARVRRMQMIVYGAPLATAGVFAGAVVAVIQQKTKAGMREDSAYRSNPFSYTTPFSSGFGPVV
jgi:hypothetical protein